jgi:hypothetical protein
MDIALISNGEEVLGGGDLNQFSQGGGRETFQETFCHSLGLAKIGQKISGQNVTAFGINIYSGLKFHSVPNHPDFYPPL